MDMRISPKVLSTSTLSHTAKISNMVNSSVLLKPKLKLRKLMKIMKRKINKILRFGKLLKLENQRGTLNGEREDQDGTLNALLWLLQYLARN